MTQRSVLSGLLIVESIDTWGGGVDSYADRDACIAASVGDSRDQELQDLHRHPDGGEVNDDNEPPPPEQAPVVPGIPAFQPGTAFIMSYSNDIVRDEDMDYRGYAPETTDNDVHDLLDPQQGMEDASIPQPAQQYWGDPPPQEAGYIADLNLSEDKSAFRDLRFDGDYRQFLVFLSSLYYTDSS